MLQKVSNFLEHVYIDPFFLAVSLLAHTTLLPVGDHRKHMCSFFFFVHVATDTTVLGMWINIRSIKKEMTNILLLHLIELAGYLRLSFKMLMVLLLKWFTSNTSFFGYKSLKDSFPLNSALFIINTVSFTDINIAFVSIQIAHF